MQGRDSEIKPTSSFQRIPVDDTLQESRVSAPRGSLLAFAQDDLALRLNPYPTHYRSAFAFSTILYPQPYRLALRRAFPSGRITGLPRSMKTAESVRSRFSAGGATSATGEVRAPVPDHLPFWFKRKSLFRLSELTTFISDSHLLTIRLNPSLRPHEACSHCLISRFDSHLSVRVHCPRSFAHHRYQRCASK